MRGAKIRKKTPRTAFRLLCLLPPGSARPRSRPSSLPPFVPSARLLGSRRPVLCPPLPLIFSCLRSRSSSLPLFVPSARLLGFRRPVLSPPLPLIFLACAPGLPFRQPALLLFRAPALRPVCPALPPASPRPPPAVWKTGKRRRRVRRPSAVSRVCRCLRPVIRSGA